MFAHVQQVERESEISAANPQNINPIYIDCSLIFVNLYYSGLLWRFLKFKFFFNVSKKFLKILASGFLKKRQPNQFFLLNYNYIWT